MNEAASLTNQNFCLPCPPFLCISSPPLQIKASIQEMERQEREALKMLAESEAGAKGGASGEEKGGDDAGAGEDEEDLTQVTARGLLYHLLGLLREKRVGSFTNRRCLASIVKAHSFLRLYLPQYRSRCCLAAPPTAPTGVVQIESGLVCVQWYLCDEVEAGIQAPAAAAEAAAAGSSMVQAIILLGPEHGAVDPNDAAPPLDTTDPHNLAAQSHLLAVTMDQGAVRELQSRLSAVRFNLEEAIKHHRAAAAVDGGAADDGSGFKAAAQEITDYGACLRTVENLFQQQHDGDGAGGAAGGDDVDPELAAAMAASAAAAAKLAGSDGLGLGPPLSLAVVKALERLFDVGLGFHDTKVKMDAANVALEGDLGLRIEGSEDANSVDVSVLPLWSWLRGLLA